MLYTQIGPYKDISKKVVRVTTMWLCDGRKKYITSSVYDCTVEDVEYIYNTLSLLLLLKMCILSLL